MQEKKFEELIEELIEVSNSLEKDELTLDESIEKFEKGLKLYRECNKKLEQATGKIEKLIKETETITEMD